MTPFLAAQVDRVVREGVYEPDAFFVRPLGFVERTAARRISYEESLEFEAVHDRVYREHGFRLVDVPAAPVQVRADLVHHHVVAVRDESEPSPVARRPRR